MIPVTIVDDFFIDPDKIVGYAKTLQYSDKDSKYPGHRTECLSVLNPELYQEIISKVSTCISESPVYTNRCNVHFQFSDSNYKRGAIHQDQKLTCIVYLSKEKDQQKNSGTSFYKLSDDVFVPDLTSGGDKHKLIENKDYAGYENYCESVSKQFVKTIDVNNEYNRAVIFPGNCWHAANDFSLNENGEPRLFLIIFFDDILLSPKEYKKTL